MTHDDPGSAKRHFAPHGVRDDVVRRAAAEAFDTA
jgi:hypothetical protein